MDALCVPVVVFDALGAESAEVDVTGAGAIAFWATTLFALQRLRKSAANSGLMGSDEARWLEIEGTTVRSLCEAIEQVKKRGWKRCTRSPEMH